MEWMLNRRKKREILFLFLNGRESHKTHKHAAWMIKCCRATFAAAKENFPLFFSCSPRRTRNLYSMVRRLPLFLCCGVKWTMKIVNINNKTCLKDSEHIHCRPQWWLLLSTKRLWIAWNTTKNEQKAWDDGKSVIEIYAEEWKITSSCSASTLASPAWLCVSYVLLVSLHIHIWLHAYTQYFILGSLSVDSCDTSRL